MSSNAASIRESLQNDYSSPPPPSNQVASSAGQTSIQRPPNPAPSWLETRFNHVLFDRRNTRVFKLWWERTPYGQQVKAGNPNFPDPDWGSANRRSKAWDNFIEAADSTSGKPCIFCYRCERSLKHPPKNHTSAGNLKNHLKTRSCIQGAAQRQLPEIGATSSREVSVFVYRAPSQRQCLRHP
jgi:hypothetical protein